MLTPLTEVSKKDLSGSILEQFNQVHLRDAYGKFSSAGSAYNEKVRQGARKHGHGSTAAQFVEAHPGTATAGALALAGLSAVGIRNALYVGRLSRASAPAHSFSSAKKTAHIFDIRATQMEDTGEMMGGFGHRIVESVSEGKIGRLRPGKIPRGTQDSQAGGYFEPSNLPGHMIHGMAGDKHGATAGQAYARAVLDDLTGDTPEASLRNVEKFIKRSDTENAFILDGDRIVTGTKGHLVMTQFWLPKNYKLKGQKIIGTHNHPQMLEKQVRGFSPGDFNVLATLVKGGAGKDSTFRAVYADGTVEEIQITNWRRFNRFVGAMNQSVGIKAQKLDKEDPDFLHELLHAQAEVQKWASESGKHGFRIVEHKDFAKSLTPLYTARPRSIQDPLSGRFIFAGPHKTADVLEGAGVAKRAMSDVELHRRKKLQAGIAVTTSTLGLTALGMKGGSIAAGRAAKAAKAGRELPKFKTDHNWVMGHPQKTYLGKSPKAWKQRSKKLNSAAINTGIVSSGIGGVGGYNFASYTRAEAKKKQPGQVVVKRDWMNISEHERRARDSRRTKRGAGVVAGLGLAGGSLTVNHALQSGRKPFGEAGIVARAAKAGVKRRNLRQLPRVVRANPHGSGVLAAYGAAGLAGGVAAGARINEKRHDRAIAGMRRSRTIGKSYGGIMDFGLDGIHQGGHIEEVSKFEIPPMKMPKLPKMPGIKLGNPAKMTVKSTVVKPKQITSGPSTAVGFPKTGMSTRKKVGIGAAIGTTAVGGGVGYHELNKAYDPERNRKRRLGAYQGATMFGAGAVGAAAGHQAGRTVHNARRYKALSVHEAPEAKLAFGKGTLKSSGKTAALGVGAAGAVMASNRIGRYRRSRGRSYSPLHTIGY